jgi:hypothetical protein
MTYPAPSIGALHEMDAEWLVVWVPGTYGNAVHEGFLDAVEEHLGKDARMFSVDYPASADFATSVPAGLQALSRLIERLVTEKAPFQKILLGGSSQGAWVIHDFMESDPNFNHVHKTVTFGLPALSGHHPAAPSDSAPVWDVTSAYDAVGWGWAGSEARILHHVSQVNSGKPWHAIPLLPYLLLNPVHTVGFIGLLLTHFNARRLSPHDYTPAMPLAVAWLTN